MVHGRALLKVCSVFAALSLQVRQSFATSLRNLGTDYIDSLVLHSPMRTHDQSMTGRTDCGQRFAHLYSMCTTGFQAAKGHVPAYVSCQSLPK